MHPGEDIETLAERVLTGTASPADAATVARWAKSTAAWLREKARREGVAA